MRSSVKKRPTIVCRRGVWRGLELSIKSLPLRNKKPDDENHPVFLYPPTTVASSACIREEGDTKKGCASTRFCVARAPAASGEGMPEAKSQRQRGVNAQPVRVSTIPAPAWSECTVRQSRIIPPSEASLQALICTTDSL